MAPNLLSFVALANEYCQAMENTGLIDRTSFIDVMLRLLPRIYITVSDIPDPSILSEASYIPESLDEEHYESVRQNVARLMGEDDTYLEVFEEDMKYSDTPIAATISEGLSDIFQVLFNFIENVKDAPEEIIMESVDSVKEDFRQYWSQILCNTLRPLNSIKYFQSPN